jgi:L-malate glycosyltransferase
MSRSLPRIMHLIGQLHKGGAERQLFLLSAGLKKSNDVCVISMTQGGYWKDQLQSAGVEVFELAQTGSKDVRRLLQIRALIKSWHPDILHTWMWEGNSYGRLASFGIKKLKRVAAERVVDPNRRGWQNWLDTTLGKKTEMMICNSQNGVLWTQKTMKYPSAKTRVIYNGLEIPDTISDMRRKELRKELGLDESDRIILSAGRMIPQKAQSVFIDACAILAAKRNDLCFILAGDGPLCAELKLQADNLGLGSRLKFLGVRDDLQHLIQISDVVCMSSLYEGLSNVLMETGILGIPAVATPASGNSEIIRDGQTGFIVPFNSPSIMADKVGIILNDAELAKKFSRKSLEVTRAKFSTAKMVSDYLSAYNSLCGIDI